MATVPPIDTPTTWARGTLSVRSSAAASSASWAVVYTGSGGRSVSPTPRLSNVMTRKWGARALTWAAHCTAGAARPLISSTASPCPLTS